MKFSKLFAPTTKEAPKDAVLASHKFLIRAGYIAQTGSGLYNYLPLGEMVLANIKQIMREEMNRAGANEVTFSLVTPGELWKQSGRFGVYGKELLRFKDRKENDFVISPTNEESAVNMIKDRVTSYKQLPVHIYQINTKFRDEARPRFGILRGREFIMKDGYSFHSSYEDLKREFDLMEVTYSKIFTRLGLDFRVVEADSGAIGGSGSKEFMVLASSGEDDIIACESCNYAANVEAAKRKPREYDGEAPHSNGFNKFYTPNIDTIDKLAHFFRIDPFFTIKAVIKKVVFEKSSEIVVFFVRGDDELQEIKALSACGGLEFGELSADEIEKVGLVAGYCGPARLPQEVNFYIDSELKDARDLICGANQKDYHFIGFNVVNFNENRFADLVEVKQGDLCPKCGARLSSSKGVEVGHIFQLKDKYSVPMDAKFLDENGKAVPFMMGCYGIGVSRLMAVMVEASNDEKGIIWQKSVTPFDIEIIVSNVKDKEQIEFASSIYDTLIKDGKKVLFDDRDQRFGVKMSEFELMGFPYALIIGKGLKNATVELVKRDGLTKTTLNKDEALEAIKEIC
ncbi:MAG: proline--tRNA ligase [Campylobacter sp.]|nr:proline--tRNA ligase [Campylobacter sp.]